MQSAKYQEAAHALKDLDEHSCDPRLSLLFAASLEGEGDAEKSQRVLERAHSSWPSDNSIAASLARQYFAANQIDKAVDALEQFHATPTTSLQELQLAAVVLISGHRLDAAQAVADTAYRVYPSLQTLLLLANAQQLQGRFKEVITLLTKERPTYSDQPEFLITLAESEYDAVLYDTARDDLQHAIALKSDSYQAHLLLGNVWSKLGDTTKAISEYQISVEQSPRQPRPHYQLALAYESNHDKEAAKHELAKVLSLNDSYAPAHIEMARILEGENLFPDAVAQLNSAIAQNPNSEQAYFLLAKAYAQLGDKQKSDAVAKQLEEVRNANTRSASTVRNSEKTPGQASVPE